MVHNTMTLLLLLIISVGTCAGQGSSAASCNTTQLGICQIPLANYGFLFDPSLIQAACAAFQAADVCVNTTTTCSTTPYWMEIMGATSYVCGPGMQTYIQYQPCLKGGFFQMTASCPSAKIWGSANLTQPQICSVLQLGGQCAYYVGLSLCGSPAAAQLTSAGFLAYQWPGYANVCPMPGGGGPSTTGPPMTGPPMTWPSTTVNPLRGLLVLLPSNNQPTSAANIIMSRGYSSIYLLLVSSATAAIALGLLQKS